MKSKKIIWSLFTALFALLIVFHKAEAIEYGMLGGKPANPDPNVENSGSWFIYKLSPGETKDDAVEVNNLFSESWKALIYAADTTPSSSGGFALEQFSEPKDEVGSWVKFYPGAVPDFFQGIFEAKEKKISALCRLSREEIQSEFDIQNKKAKIKPKVEDAKFEELEKWCAGVESVEKEMASKEKLLIPFVIKIPENADVGEHTGGILIQKIEPETQQTNAGSAIKLTTRVGIRIYETVPGEIIKKLTLEDFKVIKNFKEFSFTDWFGDPKKTQEYLVQSSVRNDGNVSIEQENIIHVKDLLFKKRSEDVNRKFQVLKKDSFISNYSWRNPRFGRFSFSTEMKYKDASGQEVIAAGPEIKIWVIPWREMAIAFALFALAFAGYAIWKFYHRKKYGGKGWLPYAVQGGEDIVAVSRKYNVNWKVLAKVNKLKVPYILEAGQVILIPPDPEALPAAIDAMPKPEENVPPVSEEKPQENAEEKKEETTPEIKTSQEDFIAKLAQRDNSIKKEEIIEKKEAFWKKRKKLIWIAPGAVVLATGVWGAVAFLGKSGKKETVIQEKISISSVGGNQNDPAENPPKNEEKDSEKAKPEKEDKNSKIGVMVLNGGAPEGEAGKIKDVLASAGYEKAEAKNALTWDHSGAAVYYKNEDLKAAAEKIKELLSEQKIDAVVKKAATEEQKSADIVVMLGKD